MFPDRVTIRRFAELTGYSQAAVRAKIEKGVWGEGIWIKAPDGRILMSIGEFELWVEGQGSGRLEGGQRHAL